MRTRRALAIAGLAALGTTLLAVPAHAYDVQAYEYAAGHMLQTSDVPKGLGDFGTGMEFFATERSSSFSACSTDTYNVIIKGGNRQASALFSNGGDGGNSLTETVLSFASASKAISAFNKAKSSVKGCLGTQTGSWGDDTTTYTYSSTTTTGSVPMVTVTGVPSFFINTDNVDTANGSVTSGRRDQYLVFTLVDSAIIVTDYERADDSNVSTSLRKKVNQAAFNAVTRWVE